jgi:hypothetical protein
MSRPHARETKEPVPRQSLTQAAKLIAEGMPAKIEMVLGWALDTHLLIIWLPVDKFIKMDLQHNRNTGIKLLHIP